MTRDQVKQAIEACIVELQGAREAEIASDPQIVAAAAAGFNYTRLCDELIDEGRIVAVHYTAPELSYRTKSFYLPYCPTVKIAGSTSRG